jgi:type II secretory pathway pseudopilin PulG
MAVVIAILGVLAAVATPMLVNHLAGAKERAYEADLGTVQTAVDAWFTGPKIGPGYKGGRFQGRNQYPLLGRGEVSRTSHTVRTASFDHPDDGTPLVAEADSIAGNDSPDWNPLGGVQGADLAKAGATATADAWTDDADGVREIIVAASGTDPGSPDKWTTIKVTKEGVTYYVDSRYYFVDMDALVNDGFLKEVPKSSSSDNSATGTGSYIYYVDDIGRVQTLLFSFPKTTNKGFKAGVYP